MMEAMNNMTKSRLDFNNNQFKILHREESNECHSSNRKTRNEMIISSQE